MPMPEPAQIEMFPTRFLLWGCDSVKNMWRSYNLTVLRDLFGGVTLVREWGRIGFSGQSGFEPFSDERQAVDAVTDTVRPKNRTGHTKSPAGAP